MKTRKGRILEVKIERCIDDSPDASFLGEYSSNPGPADKTIDRRAAGDWERGTFQYFIAALSGEESGNPESVKQDYERMEALNKGDWCFIGIKAKAAVKLTESDLTQTLHSGGLWGIESDAGEDYLTEEEENQLAELRQELKAVGFGKRAIDKAFQTITRKDC